MFGASSKAYYLESDVLLLVLILGAFFLSWSSCSNHGGIGLGYRNELKAVILPSLFEANLFAGWLWTPSFPCTFSCIGKLLLWVLFHIMGQSQSLTISSSLGGLIGGFVVFFMEQSCTTAKSNYFSTITECWSKYHILGVRSIHTCVNDALGHFHTSWFCWKTDRFGKRELKSHKLGYLLLHTVSVRERGGGGLFVFSWVLFGFCLVLFLLKTAVVEGGCSCETPADRVIILAAEKGF